jgi:hypothetical protein
MVEEGGGGDDEQEQRPLRGCPGPLPDPAKFDLYKHLQLKQQSLDRVVASFVEHHSSGGAYTDQPCFRFKVGANMAKLVDHWPNCPLRHGLDVLPAIGDQLIRTRADLALAMLHRFGRDDGLGAQQAWPLDGDGFPDWEQVAGALRCVFASTPPCKSAVRPHLSPGPPPRSPPPGLVVAAALRAKASTPCTPWT